MSDFDPGEGWRPLADDEVVENSAAVVTYSDGDSVYRSWVRELPVPPLPTEPYTVISVKLHAPGSTPHVWTLHEDGRWHAPLGYYRFPGDLAEAVTGFEVLSEPRAVTAKAVIDRVRAQELPMFMEQRLDKIAREFGASA